MLDIEECFSMSHKIQFFWEHYGQTVPFIVLLFTNASHSCPCLHFQITFLCDPRDTCVGFSLFFFDHWRANSGFKVARSLIPSTTLAPEQIGHFSPAERLLTLVCHSCPQSAFHHTILLEPYVILSGVSGRFLSDHSQTSSGCATAKLLFIPQTSLFW